MTINMSRRRDPWQPVALAIYHITIIPLRLAEPWRKWAIVSREYDPDAEPLWLSCRTCGVETLHEVAFWPLENETTYWCTECGYDR